jgi:hypothetical protein
MRCTFLSTLDSDFPARFFFDEIRERLIRVCAAQYLSSGRPILHGVNGARHG